MPKNVVGSTNGYSKLHNKLFNDPLFDSLSNEAKIIYAVMFNQHEFTLKNGWSDERGDVFILFPIENVQKIIKKGKKFSIKTVKELVSIGLITKVKQGACKPDKIYVKNILDFPLVETSCEVSVGHHGGVCGTPHEVSVGHHGGVCETPHEVSVGHHGGVCETPPYILNQSSYNKPVFFNQSINQTVFNNEPTIAEVKPQNIKDDGWMDGWTDEQKEIDINLSVMDELKEYLTLPISYLENKTKLTVAFKVMLENYNYFPQDENHQESDDDKLESLFITSIVEMLNTKGTQTLGQTTFTAMNIYNILLPQMKITQYNTLDVSHIFYNAAENYKSGSSQSEIKIPKQYMKTCIITALEEMDLKQCNFDYNSYLDSEE